MQRTLFFDIDGTLVSFASHEVPASAIEAITQAHERGHKVVIATGRPYLIINNLSALQKRGLIDGYITMNGSYCFIGSQVLHKQPIPPTDVKRMTELCRKHGYAIIYVGDHVMKVVQPSPEVKAIFNDYLHVDTIPEATFDDVEGMSVYQLTVFINSEQEEAIAPEMSGSEFNRWYPTFVDITARGVTKAQGLELMMKALEMPMEASVSFGDGGNDISMLRRAAIGVAMGNAAPAVQAQADMVTDTVDSDGIAKALRQLNIID